MQLSAVEPDVALNGSYSERKSLFVLLLIIESRLLTRGTKTHYHFGKIALVCLFVHFTWGTSMILSLKTPELKHLY